MRILIAGAGISGLSTAHFLRKKGFAVRILEKNAFPGGTIRTVRDGGWLVELGPNSALETTPLFRELFDDLGITADRQYADPSSSRRYIVKSGKLHALPMSPGAFLATGLWSVTARLRLLGEPFIGRAGKEESIAEFVTRRLGREFLDYAIDPFVAGVFAGNPSELSVRLAFPKLFALEEKYGSLSMGAVRSRRERKKRKEVAKDRARIFSFPEGMKTIPLALAESLGSSIAFGCSIEHIIPMRAGRRPVYTVTYTQNGERQTEESDVVIYSTPAHATAGMVQRIDPDTAKTLESVYYPPVTEVFLGFNLNQIARPLDGFGFLAPTVERRNILGAIWSSALFPGRAPEGCAAMTCFVGGSRQPEIAAKGDDELLKLVLEDLRTLMDIEGDPVYRQISRWSEAIPQYNLGYHEVLRTIERFEQNFQGSFVCSNYRGGISVGDCLMSAEKTAGRVAEYSA